MLKHAFNNEFINLLFKIGLHLTERNVKLSEVVRQLTKQHRSLLCAAARKKKGIYFKRNQLVHLGGSFFSLLLLIFAGLIHTFL